uniref:Uncharacterized protein n=1 Tax=Arion vulgaris TaxID=1028688 RepID=A0A0B7BMS7_9EUPU
MRTDADDETNARQICETLGETSNKVHIITTNDIFNVLEKLINVARKRIKLTE